MAESLGITETSSPMDGLIAGDWPPREKRITVKSGQGVVARGTVMGKITKELGAIGVVLTTGNGTLTSVALRKSAKIGSYTVMCVFVDAGNTYFVVKDPDGNTVEFLAVAIAPSSTFDLENSHLAGTLTQGATPFAAGDYFTVAVDVPAEEEWVKSLAAAVDGSQDIDCIMTEEVDATSEAVLKSGYISGDFDESKLVLGAGHSADSLREAARAKGIYFHSVTQVPTF